MIVQYYSSSSHRTFVNQTVQKETCEAKQQGQDIKHGEEIFNTIIAQGSLDNVNRKWTELHKIYVSLLS